MLCEITQVASNAEIHLLIASLYSIIWKYGNSNCLDVSNLPLHLTRTCPQNQTEMIERGSAINCSKNYMCLPNENLTELFEICIQFYSIRINKGLCLVLFNKSRIVLYDCRTFDEGCPDETYYSNKMFQYPQCTKIKDGCFLADMSCGRTSVSTHSPDNPNDTSKETRYNVVPIVIYTSSCVLLISLCILLRRSFRQKVVDMCTKGKKKKKDVLTFFPILMANEIVEDVCLESFTVIEREPLSHEKRKPETPIQMESAPVILEESILDTPTQTEFEPLFPVRSYALIPNPYTATEQLSNLNRVSRLLMGPCTDQLRDLLRFYIPPDSFPAVIERERSRLPRLTESQRKLILPNYGSFSGNYDDMDISLLYILLKTVCGIQAHKRGWGNAPDSGDRSVSANIERLRLTRNICSHSTGGMSNAEFNKFWSVVRAAVVDLDKTLGIGNKYQEEVDKLVKPMKELEIIMEKLDKIKMESRTSSSHPYAATEQMTNLNRVSRLLMGPCTDQLRDLLRFYIPPDSFPAVIERERSRLPRLTESQRKLILPNYGSFSGNYDDMDISLLYILLKTVCGIQAHNRGWGNAPDSGDRSVSANIERLRLTRNICSHSTGGMSNAEFNKFWSEVRAAVVDLDKTLGIGNKYQEEVDIIRNDTLIPCRQILEERVLGYNN
uniref:Uncharacterized protein LOC111110858 isoform X2 n=1 Tax=Crassostrea virginica TaxID=6565 RepID=A0A8B8BK30_CRAVI|nr:uncharacterized protein LOC111110858 isoform X2 [Crassostrea virginica]